jgi:hypothetical protein
VLATDDVVPNGTGSAATAPAAGKTLIASPLGSEAGCAAAVPDAARDKGAGEIMPIGATPAAHGRSLAA